MPTNNLGQGREAMSDSSEDEIETDGYETDLSSVADDPKPDPIKLRIERGLEKLVAPSKLLS
jgi:hypothetical protein